MGGSMRRKAEAVKGLEGTVAAAAAAAAAAGVMMMGLRF